MPTKPPSPSKLAGKMAVADRIVREDGEVLRALTGREWESESQLKIARDVMVRRRPALQKLAKD